MIVPIARLAICSFKGLTCSEAAEARRLTSDPNNEEILRVSSALSLPSVSVPVLYNRKELRCIILGYFVSSIIQRSITHNYLNSQRCKGIFYIPFHHAYTVPKIWFMHSQKRNCAPLRGLVPSSYIQVSVSNLYISRIGLPIWLQQNRQTDPGNI
jgi:hypothetical protein